MKSRVVIIGILGVCAFGLAALPARAQGIFDDGFRLNNPALFRGSTLPSFFSPESYLTSAALGVTSLEPSLSAPVSTRATNIGRSSLLDRLTPTSLKPDYVSGEIGFLYGQGIGKHGGDFNEEYIVGEVGNDHFHIVVGAAHQESNFDFSRRR